MMKFRKSESGVVFVEASIVFPVMIIVIFLMIFAGNAYYQKCRVEAIANEIAVEGAAQLADPMLQYAESGELPGLEEVNVYPYRAFDPTGVGDTVEKLEGELVDRIEGLGTGYFGDMQPDVENVKADYKNAFIYSTFTVDVQYKIRLPIRMIGEDDYYYLDFSTHVSMPVSDSTELMRNVDMVEDYLQKTGVAEKIEEFTGKIKDAITAAKDWMTGG